MRVRKEQGFTLIELLIVIAIVSIIASIAVPGLQRARMSGNEASAIGSMRAINSAEAAYTKATGGGGFATSLVVLGAVCPAARRRSSLGTLRWTRRARAATTSFSGRLRETLRSRKIVTGLRPAPTTSRPPLRW